MVPFLRKGLAKIWTCTPRPSGRVCASYSKALKIRAIIAPNQESPATAAITPAKYNKKVDIIHNPSSGLAKGTFRDLTQ